ncbi:hypothetical protein D3C76_1865950 [compost metagenome]
MRVGRRGDQVLDFLDQDLVFVTLLVDVANGRSGEGVFGDIALGFTLDADIGGSCH